MVIMMVMTPDMMITYGHNDGDDVRDDDHL